MQIALDATPLPVSTREVARAHSKLVRARAEENSQTYESISGIFVNVPGAAQEACAIAQ